MFRVIGSSLIEVIIAMVMIIVVFGIAMMIYTNVIRSSVSTIKIQAQSVINDELLQAEQAGTTRDSSYIKGELTIERTFTSSGQHSDLQTISISALNAQHDTVAKIQKVLLK